MHEALEALVHTCQRGTMLRKLWQSIYRPVRLRHEIFLYSQ